MEWQIPLLVSAMVFAVFLIFKVRPEIGRHDRARIAAAKDAPAKLDAILDAADECARRGRTNAAVHLYLRAIEQEASEKVVTRATSALAKRPRAVEKLMWRVLAKEPARETTRAALRALAASVKAPRRKALEHLLTAVDG